MWWVALQPTIDVIDERERDVIVATHNRMTPDVSHRSVDIIGNSGTHAMTRMPGVGRQD